MTTARPSPWRRILSCRQGPVALVVSLLLPLLLVACGPAGGGGGSSASPPGPASTPLGGQQPHSEAQEAMVDRQLFAPQFPSATPPAPSLQAPLGNPGAGPLGSGALFN